LSNAIEQIANAYVRLGKRQRLEDLLTYRRKLAVDLKMKSGFDFKLLISQVEEEIAAIEAGIERLSDYKVPETIDLTAQPLPRNANGKVMKRQLPRRCGGGEDHSLRRWAPPVRPPPLTP
jgi:capsule polysaccharide export protein KpsE/RkpR